MGRLVSIVKKSRPLGERPAIKKKGESAVEMEVEDGEEEAAAPSDETQPIGEGRASP